MTKVLVVFAFAFAFFVSLAAAQEGTQRELTPNSAAPPQPVPELFQLMKELTPDQPLVNANEQSRTLTCYPVPVAPSNVPAPIDSLDIYHMTFTEKFFSIEVINPIYSIVYVVSADGQVMKTGFGVSKYAAFAVKGPGAGALATQISSAMGRTDIEKQEKATNLVATVLIPCANDELKKMKKNSY